MTRYRIVYKDGSHGAWTTNYEWIKECVEFFSGSRMEEKIF